MPRKIAYFRKGIVPIANERVAHVLEKNFQDFEIEIIDVLDIVKSRKRIIFINLLHLIKEYGLYVLLSRDRVRHYFFTTPYMFNLIKSLVSDHLAKDDYIFSFQIQSLFDASVEGLPHFVYTDHTALANLSYPDFNVQELYTKSWLELEKTIYQNATIIFTRSTNISKSLIEQYACNPNQIRCVYAGSNASISNENVTFSKYKRKNILFVGRDWKRKGGPELVKAFEAVLKVHPDAQLTIVGCSPRLDVPNCNVVGQMPVSKISGYYKDASIFCMPTKREPFGIVFIEAMRHKLPVVATNIGAIPDFVKEGENGCLVNPGDVDRLAEALIDLIGQPDKCQAFGMKGYQIATEKYTWENVGLRIREGVLSTNLLAKSYQPINEM